MLTRTTLAVIVLHMVDCANILALVPFPARSHWIIMEPLFRELASRGHQLTVFSTFPQQPPLANYTDVDLTAQISPFTNNWTIKFAQKEISSPQITFSFVHRVHTKTCKVLQHPHFKNLMKAKGQYDILITELFGNDCFAYFAHILDIPLISVVTTPGSAWSADRTGMPDNPSYIPNLFVDSNSHMTFWERFYNSFVIAYAKWFYYFPISKVTREISETNLGVPLPLISDVVSKTSLLLVNTHFSIIQSRPFPPNVIEIAGIHIKDRQPLEQDLKTILDKSESGAIIFSLGSLLTISSLPNSTMASFMKAFSKIPQTVILKYEGELLYRPSNVITRKWLPQRDLLGHKNLVAAFVHGGMASTIEMVYFGKPIIGIPVFGDQSHNIRHIVQKGAGVLLNLDEISEKRISAALSEVLNNPKYTQNMKRLSAQFRDRPQTALQSAVFWTEYVIRHKGAPQLRPVSVDLPLYQYLLLDVIAVLAVVLAVVLYCLYRSVCLVLYLVTKKRTIRGKKQN